MTKGNGYLSWEKFIRTPCSVLKLFFVSSVFVPKMSSLLLLEVLMLMAITRLFLVREFCLSPHCGPCFITSSISTLSTCWQRVYRKQLDLWTKLSIFAFLPHHGSQALTQKCCLQVLAWLLSHSRSQKVRSTSHLCGSKQKTSLRSHSSFASSPSANPTSENFLFSLRERKEKKKTWMGAWIAYLSEFQMIQNQVGDY